MSASRAARLDRFRALGFGEIHAGAEDSASFPARCCRFRAPRAPPRKTESDGKWYNFVSEAEFQQMVERGEFLEYAQVFGKNWYGTPRKWLDEAHGAAQRSGARD